MKPANEIKDEGSHRKSMKDILAKFLYVNRDYAFESRELSDRFNGSDSSIRKALGELFNKGYINRSKIKSNKVDRKVFHYVWCKERSPTQLGFGTQEIDVDVVEPEDDEQ